MLSVLLFVLGVVIFLVGLAVSIALHELGHLSFAKAFGVKVTQYMIGFGKTVFSLRRGETEYGVKMLPLGGYIAMIGMFPPRRPGEKARDASTGFYDSLAHAPGTDGGGAAPGGRRRRNIYSSIVDDARSASDETIGAGEDDRAFYRLAPWKRIIVMLAGPVANLVIAAALLAIIVSGIGVASPVTRVQSVSPCLTAQASAECSEGAPASPAQKAGFRPGDTVVSIDGTAVSGVREAGRLIADSPGEPLSIVVENDGARRTLTVTPAPTRVPASDGSGTTTIGRIGVYWAIDSVRQPVTEVPGLLWRNLTAMLNVVVELPQRMVGVWNAAFSPAPRQDDSPVGIVGIGRLAGEVTSADDVSPLGRVRFLLGLLASLNIALFVINLVPLLPLDGGHVLGAVWEWIRRGFAKVFRRRAPGPVDMARLMPVTYVVVIVLGGMSLLLAYADLVDPVTLFGG